MFTQDEFARQVRDALNHLYDSPYLQMHPLAARFSAPDAEPHEASQALRQALLTAIKGLRPIAGVPASSPDWRLYRILELRYVEGLTPNETMDRLGLEKSRYFQEQARAIEAVTPALWTQYANGEAPTFDRDGFSPEASVRQEVARLLAEARWEPVELGPVWRELRPIINALASAKGATVTIDELPSLTVQRADRVILRQMLLNVLTGALDRAAGGRVEIQALAESDQVGVRILAWPSPEPERRGRPPDEPRGQEDDHLEVSRWLMQAMEGTLFTADEPDGAWQAHLAWQPARSLTLLVIDDNQGLIDLFRRYLTGFRWQIVGARNGAEAREALARMLPTVIMLDVMMPGEDGWEVLIALRHKPETQNIPVIVCSVLSAQPLAQALGASGYLAKPVTRQALLRALAPWSQAGARLAPTS